jgi:hypothetical protein
MSVFTRKARPRLWPWLLVAILAIAIWFVLANTLFYTDPTQEPISMPQRFTWWLLPPLITVFALFGGAWGVSGLRVQAAELQQQQQTAQLAAQQQAEAQSVAAALAHQQFSLEIRAVGITIDRFRQSQVLQKLDKVNHPYTSILSQDSNDYQWAGETRLFQSEQRAFDAFNVAARLWVERWPIPVMVADANGMGMDRIVWARNGTGLGITLFTGLAAHKGEDADLLVNEMFKVFDDNPDLPSVLVFSTDSQEMRGRGRIDKRFVPDIPDSMVAMLFTRSDRVDKHIRPYTVDVPYDISMDDTQYDIIKLWNFYWTHRDAYLDMPESKGSGAMPTAYWNEQVKSLIPQIDPHGTQGMLFWENSKAGFKPSPWIPVRWTKWQLEEYDSAPIVGHLHRPVEVSLQGKSAAQQAEAMAEGWKQALATLPKGSSKPEWLFYDTGADGKHVIPLARALTQSHTAESLDPNDPMHSYNLSTRIGNTGVSSPFVQLALGTMRSYDKGGVSAAVNLRQGDRASIILVEPPTPQEKANNKPNPDNNARYASDPDPFVPKMQQ